MKYGQKHPKNNSLRTLFIFCLVVFIVLCVSVFFRLIHLIQTSQFSGENRFTVAFVSSEPSLDIVSFDPQERTISHAVISGFKDINEAKKTVGVFTDTTITLKEPFSTQERLSAYFTKSMFHTGAQSSLSWYDLIRLAAATGGISENAVRTEAIRLPMERVHIDQITSELFYDRVLSEENSTIEIINGTGVAGLGGRLERALGIMGANIIAVTNSDKRQEASQLIYYGEKNYTVEHLEKILAMPSVQKEGRGLSDIIIVIGQDSEGTISY